MRSRTWVRRRPAAHLDICCHVVQEDVMVEGWRGWRGVQNMLAI
jgi:hypothetical protein